MQYKLISIKVQELKWKVFERWKEPLIKIGLKERAKNQQYQNKIFHSQSRKQLYYCQVNRYWNTHLNMNINKIL